MRGNRQRILDASVELFNKIGSIKVTTNHIAKHLGISPGNLYFHFRNKEQIVRELFQKMADETYEAWDLKHHRSPKDFIDSAYEMLWKYRFFHREMYHLRRTDPELAKMWKRHLNRCFRLLKLNYMQWVKEGAARPISDQSEMRMVTDSVLLFSSASLSFFESPEKPATPKSQRAGVEYLTRLMAPYLSTEYRRETVMRA